jgi:hypothetical protein
MGDVEAFHSACDTSRFMDIMQYISQFIVLLTVS